MIDLILPFMVCQIMCRLRKRIFPNVMLLFLALLSSAFLYNLWYANSLGRLLILNSKANVGVSRMHL